MEKQNTFENFKKTNLDIYYVSALEDFMLKMSDFPKLIFRCNIILTKSQKFYLSVEVAN